MSAIAAFYGLELIKAQDLVCNPSAPLHGYFGPISINDHRVSVWTKQ